MSREGWGKLIVFWNLFCVALEIGSVVLAAVLSILAMLLAPFLGIPILWYIGNIFLEKCQSKAKPASLKRFTRKNPQFHFNAGFWKFILIIWTIIGIAVFGYVFVDALKRVLYVSTFWVVVELCAIAGVYIWGLCVLYKKIQKAKNVYDPLRSFLRTVKKRTWKFPSENFYNYCVEHGISELPSDKIGITKLYLLANLFMVDNQVTGNLRKKYLALAKMYFAEGYALVKQEECVGDRSVGRPEIETGIKLKEILYGQKVLDDVRSEIMFQALEYENKRSKYSGSAVKDINEGTLKEKDWAIIGGAVSGVAGTLVGLGAAASTIEKNKKIREYNEWQRDFNQLYNQMVAPIVDRENRANYNMYDRKAKECWIKYYNTYITTVVKDFGADYFKEHFTVSKAKIEGKSYGKIKLEFNFICDGPDHLSDKYALGGSVGCKLKNDKGETIDFSIDMDSTGCYICEEYNAKYSIPAPQNFDEKSNFEILTLDFDNLFLIEKV